MLINLQAQQCIFYLVICFYTSVNMVCIPHSGIYLFCWVLLIIYNSILNYKFCNENYLYKYGRLQFIIEKTLNIVFKLKITLRTIYASKTRYKKI